VIGTLNIVDEMIRNDIQNIVFSSSAAIFGTPCTDVISEDHNTDPINPYGHSKLVAEQMLREVSKAHQINVICFRYFNAAGADFSRDIGEAHDPETHLIPNVLRSTLAVGQTVKVFGNDYATHDGTCIRDYVHVTDLAQAHSLGMEYMKNRNGWSAFNLGNGSGFSVLEVIQCCERITKQTISIEWDKRRLGDPPKLVADSSAATQKLRWEPKYGNLDTLIRSAWDWHRYQ